MSLSIGNTVSPPPFLNSEALQTSLEPDPVEPDYYIRSLERYGIICYKQLTDPAQCFVFAWQIAENPRLLARFDERDRHFIESSAAYERKDSWYRKAGLQLRQRGFEAFTE